MPARPGVYRDLIPLTAPRPGEQYGFEVDLDRCTGCKACVAACHSMNGLRENETWRSVGLLVNDDWRAPFQQTVTTACHHCVDPACLNGCPVLAYDKDPVTGIVRHLDDQCIGCQYCTMMCPYDVPQYLPDLGIVRKCDMCQNRLAVGEAPACAQACPNEAIRISLVERSTLFASYQTPGTLPHAPQPRDWNPFLPASPNPAITLPATRYVTAKGPLPSLRAADAATLKPAAPHGPLVGLLFLTQLSVGATAFAGILMAVRQDLESGTALLVLAWVSLLAGLGLGMTHLGQPLKAWRAFLGLRTSWFSREVVVFGLYAAAVTLAAAMTLLGAPIDLLRAGCAVATLLGLLAVFCSAMIYKATRREFWTGVRTLPRFFGTVGILGALTALAVVLVDGTDGRQAAGGFALVACLFSTIKLGVEARASRLPSDTLPDQPTPIARTALLLRGELGLEWRLRWLCGITGGVALPFMILLLLPSADLLLTGTLAAVALALSGAGEWIERRLFFTAVSPDRMPGGVVA